MDTLVGKLILGAAVGFPFGFALQRGRFCMNSAFRDLLLTRDTTLFRAYILALILQMGGIHALSEAGLIRLNVPPFAWLAAMVGGFVFGIGMTLSGGCASGSWYRIGEGMVGSIVAVLGFALGGIATAGGVLLPLLRLLRSYMIQPDGPPATIASLLGIDSWWVVSAAAAAAALWLARGAKSDFHGGWSWQRTGLVIGLVAIWAWYASTLTGRQYGLSITGPTDHVAWYLVRGDIRFLDWGFFMILALPVGALVSARLRGECKLRAPAAPRLLQQLGGGLIMGVGASLAAGCNIGNSLTGLGALGMGSLVSTLFIILGNWFTVYLLFLRK